MGNGTQDQRVQNETSNKITECSFSSDDDGDGEEQVPNSEFLLARPLVDVLGFLGVVSSYNHDHPNRTNCDLTHSTLLVGMNGSTNSKAKHGFVLK